MTAGRGVVSGVRVSHDRASVDDIEAACHADQRTVVERLHALPGVAEAFALQTCNRFEAYVVTNEPTTGRAVLAEFAPDLDDHVVVEMGHEASLRHLMRVAAGLESMVLGEDQIIGQVRDAYEDARTVGAIGPMLEDAVTKAIHVGERARTETAINEGAMSISSAAVTLADEQCALDGATALVVGAGEMGTLAAQAFADTGVETLYLANRSPERATHVAETTDHGDTRAISLDAVDTCLAEVDVVVSVTGSEDHVLDAGDFDGVGRTLVIDIAQPRDVSPAAGALDGVTVHDLDTLESVTDETKRRRQTAAESVEAMIDREFENLLEQYKRKRADEVISAMYESAERVKGRELSTALSKLEANGELTDGQRDIVESLADSLISQLLAPPTKSLREAAADDDWTTINTALQLFNPEFGDEGPPAFVTEMLAEDAPDIPDEVPEEVVANVAGDDD